MFYYRPQYEVCGQGTIFCTCLSRILFTGREVSWAGTPPQAGTHPWAGKPPRQVTPRQVHPEADTPWAGTPPRQVHSPQAGTPPGQVLPLGRYTPHQCMLVYGQQVGGTHSTGMHSCLFESISISFLIISVHWTYIFIQKFHS